MKKKFVLLMVTLVIIVPLLSVVPVMAYYDNTYQTICANGDGSRAINSDGILYVWGKNNSGEHGEMWDRTSTPGKLLDNVKSISCKGLHSLILKNDNTLWACGRNWAGELGDGQRGVSAQREPVKIMDNVKMISAGYHFSSAIKTDGTLWVWGDSQHGVIEKKQGAFIPHKIMDDVKYISAGEDYIMVIKNDNTLWGWGQNENGELGDETTVDKDVPVKIMDNVAVVSSGIHSTAAIKTDGSLWMWGENSHGQLGDNTTEDKLIPVKIMDNVNFVSTSHSTAAIKIDGSLWMWGNNFRGQLGNGTTEDSYVPIKIMDNVISVSLGNDHTMVIRNDGSLWTWGYNAYGQLGDGTAVNKYTPVNIMNDVMISDISDVASTLSVISSKPSEWALNDINSAIGLNLIPSELQSEYQTPITRLDFCKLAYALYTTLKENAVIVPTDKFTDIEDVSQDDSYTIGTVASLGIVNGYEDGTFRPYNTITREEAAVMLARTADYFGKGSTTKYPIIFGDNENISAWARSAVDLVSAIGVMSGVQVSDYILEFQPKETYTREQAMVTFYRLYDILTRVESLKEKFPDKTTDLYTLDTVPKIKINKLDANFNDYHGMYIDNYKSAENKNKSFDISFDVYNTTYIYGIVEVYDKDDNWVTAVPIKKMSDNATSIKGSVWDNSVDLINDIIKNNLLTYRQASGYSKRTSIKVNIPYGGYMRITNNAIESPLLAVLNIADIGFSTYKLSDSLINYDNSTSEKLIDKLTLNALKDEYFVNLIKEQNKDEFFEKLFKGIKKDVLMSNESAGDYVSTVIQNLEDLDLVDLVVTSARDVGISAAEKTFISFADPAGAAMAGLFLGTKAENTCVEIKHYFDTLFSEDSILIQNIEYEYF